MKNKVPIFLFLMLITTCSKQGIDNHCDYYCPTSVKLVIKPDDDTTRDYMIAVLTYQDYHEGYKEILVGETYGWEQSTVDTLCKDSDITLVFGMATGLTAKFSAAIIYNDCIDQYYTLRYYEDIDYTFTGNTTVEIVLGKTAYSNGCCELTYNNDWKNF